MPREQRDKIKLRVENKDYDVSGGTFQELLAGVKALPGRRYLPEQRLWMVPGSFPMIRRQLENSGFILEGGTPIPEEESESPRFNEQIKIQVGEHTLTVTGASFQVMLQVIKAIPGRRFDRESKTWQVPETITALKQYFTQHNLQLVQPSFETAKSDRPSSETANLEPAVNPAQNFQTDTGCETDLDEPYIPNDFRSDMPPPPPDIPPILEPPPFHEDDDEAMFYEGDLTYPDNVASSPSVNNPSTLPPETPPSSDTSPPFPATERSTSTSSSSKSSGRQDKIKVKVGDYELVITGGDFRSMLNVVKTIPGRRFDGQSKAWILPDDINSIQQHIKANGLRLTEED